MLYKGVSLAFLPLSWHSSPSSLLFFQASVLQISFTISKMSESRSFNNSQSTTDSPSQSVNANEILRAIQSSQAAAIEAASATAARMVEEKFAVLKQDSTEEAAT